MRQIKFRGKRTDTGAWVYGNLLTTSNGYGFIDTNNELYEDESYIFRDNTDMIRVAVSKVGESTVGQFTGLLDKNGKEIYEDDVVTWTYSDSKQRMDVVRWVNGGLCLCNGQYTVGNYGGLEIVRNIHDNPELMEGGEE